MLTARKKFDDAGADRHKVYVSAHSENATFDRNPDGMALCSRSAHDLSGDLQNHLFL